MTAEMDRIEIKGLRVFAHHGVLPEETEQGQNFFVDLTLFTDLREAGTQDDLAATTDYGAVCQTVTQALQGRTCRLIEAAAEYTAREVLLRYPLVRAVDLRLRKPEAPIPLPFDTVAVRIHRGWQRAYLALGSNLGDRERYLKTALRQLAEHPLVRLLKTSSLIETAPYGGVEQGDFLNGVCLVETLMQPLELLHFLQHLEQQAQRVREVRWGPRTLDLDVLFWEDQVLDLPELTVPHPDLQNRTFVLEPMVEIAPHFCHPLLGKTMQQLLRELKAHGTDRRG